MNLFYQGNLSETSQNIIFDKDESRHIFKVLRHKLGDTLHITNGLGILFTAELVEVSQKQCLAVVNEAVKKAPLPYYLHIAVAPTKNNDRFEWFLEKATEIGISEITPILCDHSERKVIKVDRFERIIESAMKQSLKMYKPKLNELTSFSGFIKLQSNFNGIKCIAHCEDSEKELLKNLVQPKSNNIILIGPEGDFSYTEIALAQKNDFSPISLGESRLRTETAAISACHTVYCSNL
ncbi:16S rRNA (uracil(1498)-N(3))-methyltransferase [Aureisphaera sp. CAU 1614]|uniref:Ribosomal RNA small subunit methyltransferase E n=1 Tax=Halomarinibacterium sedimenti TaxID=2857106 RepID=A0A9X1FNW3_9FLAO|nr:16S rRNA (uracil(1498)-N(3))-methyltransferase [Halomarinibacterium sedimenti]MBW2937896.1 16S rRNA (uracil(1498)-N(3))-methyltransferase [Halomarinibacterium sedimenti]